MFLSDRDIKVALKAGEILIENFDPMRLQPASYDVLLGFNFMIFQSHKLEIIDPRKPVTEFMLKIELKDENDYFVLHPNQFALASTWDYIGVNGSHCYHLMGKSSLARLGLIIHTTAGFIDPGNALCPTLELFNTNIVPIKLYPKMKIGQVAFYKLSSPVERPYGHKDLHNKYLHDRDVVGSKMHENYLKKRKK